LGAFSRKSRLPPADDFHGGIREAHIDVFVDIYDGPVDKAFLFVKSTLCLDVCRVDLAV
jgi:hypothetical protein